MKIMHYLMQELIDILIVSFYKILEILLEIQKQEDLHYISKKNAYYVAEKLSISPSQIYDVISFFEALHSEPRAKYPIQICDSVVCRVNKSDNLLDNLKEILGVDINEATYDNRFIIEKVACFGACDQAPAIRINNFVYGKLTTKEKVREVLEKFM